MVSGLALASTATALEASRPPRPAVDPVCTATATMANAGTLRRALVPAGTLSEEQFKKTFSSSEHSFGALRFYRQLDLNGDGHPEHVAIFQFRDGEDIAEIVTMRPGATVDLRILEESILPAAGSLEVVRIGGRPYLLAGEMAGGLYELGKDHTLRLRCAFERDDPPAKLAAVSDPAVCRAFQDGTLTPVAFDHMHVLGRLDRALYPETHPAEGLARVDIDNDGVPDNVVRLGYSGTRGPLCGDFFRVTDATRTQVADRPVNALLAAMPCADDPRLFTFAGRTYLARQETDTSWVLQTLSGGGWREVCTRKTRARVRALSRREVEIARAGGTNPWVYALEKSPDALADFRELIQAGRDVNEAIGEDGSPLGHAVWRKRYDLAELLLANGARSEPNGVFRDALAKAVLGNDPRMVSLLLKYGAPASPMSLSVVTCEKERLALLELFGKAGLLSTQKVPIMVPKQADRAQLPTAPSSSQLFITARPEPGTFDVGQNPRVHDPSGTTFAFVREEVDLVDNARRCGNLEAVRIIEQYRARP